MSEGNLPRGNGDLPLLDEINDLIEKERTLLGLKLAVQKSEADEWKAKYDDLARKLSAVEESPSAGEPELQDDQIAEIGGKEQPYSTSLREVHHVISDRANSWVLDLSGLKISKQLFARVTKAVFGPRNAFEDIHVAIMKDCSLSDEYTQSILTTVRGSNMLALDLSNNFLGESFLLQLISLLKDRRSTPQYLLLEGNFPLASTVKHFGTLVDTVTDCTWGVTASLQDFHDTMSSSSGSVSNKRVKGGKELNHDYKEIIKQPMRAYEFLKAINAKLDPAEKDLVTKISGKKTAKLRSAIPGRENALHHIAVLGLKLCLLSKKSVEQLKTTLRLSAPSLTDLDLSFAYVGYQGAEAIADALVSKNCQLVRLGLIGNSLGDKGACVLCSSLKVNCTLTYLDLRSNHIGCSGLRGAATSLLANSVLNCIDLRGNVFHSRTLMELQHSLDAQGSPLMILWSYLFTSPEAAVHSRQWQMSLGETVFKMPQKVKVGVTCGESVLLYSIDLARVFLNHPDKFRAPMLLDWKWRPAPHGTNEPIGILYRSELAGKTIAGYQPSSSHRCDDGYLAVGGEQIFAWEVRVTFNHQELQKYAPALSAALSAQTVSRRLAEGGGADWTHCSATLTNLPLKGAVEVWLVPRSTDSSRAKGHSAPGDVGHITSDVPRSYVEGVDASMIHVLLPRDRVLIAGDCGESSTDMLCFGQLFDGVGAGVSGWGTGPGTHVLRAFRLNGTTSPIILSWKLKLASLVISEEAEIKAPLADTARATKQAEDRDLDVSTPPSSQSLDYEWSIFLCSSSGVRKRVLHGSCYKVPASELSTDLVPGNSNPTGPRALGYADSGAWSWKAYTAELPGCQDDDVLVLTGRVISLQANSPPSALQKFGVVASAFDLYQGSLGESQGQTGSVVAAVVHHAHTLPMQRMGFNRIQTSFGSIHDDASCLLPL